MALTWEWNRKCGELTLEQKRPDGTWEQTPISLYQGNAFLIMLAENDEDNTYQLFSFFSGKDHAKNCLGLSKGYTKNIFLDDSTRISRLRLNKKKYSYTKELVELFVRAFDDITIEIYSEEENICAETA